MIKEKNNFKLKANIKQGVPRLQAFVVCVENVNDAQREKIYFTRFSRRMAAWLLLTFPMCLHNQLSSTHYITRIKDYRSLKNVVHQIGSKIEWSFLSASVTAKLGLVFVLTSENVFS